MSEQQNLPGWPPPERLAEIMEAIRRGIERYRAEFERRANLPRTNRPKPMTDNPANAKVSRETHNG